MKTAGIYVRVSTERQVQEGYSIAAQKENLISFAKMNKFKIYDIYADEGISGKDIEGRPSVKRLIEDIQNGKIDVVLVQKIDRLTRNITDTEDFIKLFQKYDVDIWSISDGKVDISNSNGKFMTLLKGLFAQHERELISERIKVAFNEKVKQGYTLCCGCTPYGYIRKKGNKIIVINHKEAIVVRKIFKLYNNNYSFTQIADILNFDGVITKRAGQIVNLYKNGEKIGTKSFTGLWSSKAIKLILSNPVYIGKVRYGIGRKDYYIGDGKHKPIINEKEWNKAQEKMVNVRTKFRTNRPKNDVYFCGTLVCGVCGKKMTSYRTMGRVRKDGTRSIFNGYRCINREKKLCTSRGASHIKVENAFIDYLERNIADFEEVNELIINDDNYLEEINNIKRIITVNKIKYKQIMELFMLEKINYSQFKYMSEKLEKNINENEMLLFNYKQMQSVKYKNNINKISRNIAEHWKLLTNKEKFDFLSEFVDSIIIVNDDSDRYNGKVEILEVKFLI